MDERALDRAVDVAAGTLMAREPSRALGHHVMARVREDAAPAPRRIVWLTAAAGVAVAAALAMVLVARAPSQTVALPREVRLPVARAAVMPGVPAGLVAETTRIESAGPRVVRTVASPAPLPPGDVSTIAAIETEPIVVATIEVPQLERETVTSIETISIDPITIEPLSASND